MNKPRLITTLLILFAIQTVASIISIYYTHQLSTEEHTTIPLCIYQHTGRFDYTAKLKPNTLYNQPTLKPGQGTLYTKITDHINITFTYTFTCSHSTNTSIQYQVLTELESPEKWTKTFTTAETLDTFQLTNTVNPTEETVFTTLFLNITKLDELVKTIDGQIGTSTSQYNLRIKPNIHITAKITITQTENRTIYESFAPSPTIQFKKETPNYISIESLEHTKPGTITDTQTTPLPWVKNLQTISYLFLAISISATVLTTFVYLKLKSTFPPKPPKPTEKLIEPYKDIIAQTTAPPPKTPQTKTINLTTLEDLAKIAETLIKPILHTQKDNEHTFYIIDNNTTYKYTTTET